MTALTVVVFLLVYLAMALGAIPGFKVDRAGAALIGAFVLQVSGAIPVATAWRSVDYSTMALLVGLMVVSAQFTMSGFYTAVTRWIATLKVGPLLFLAAVVISAGMLSALLTNDVVAVAMAPLLVAACEARRLNPIPYLLALGFAANAGSVATIIGSPQNMIIAQQLGLSFARYTLETIVPAVFALAVVWLTIALLYARKWQGAGPIAASEVKEIPFDGFETVKGIAVAVAVLAAFVFTSVPREQVALAAAGVLLLNRRFSSKDMLGLIDGNLLVMLFGLFIVNAAFAGTGLPHQGLAHLESAGIRLSDPGWLFGVTAILSDLVGNTPAIMLLAPYVDGIAAGVAITTASAFSSNLVVFGSLATIIVVEAARNRGVTISFAEFLRAGAPVTLVTLAFAFVWIVVRGAAP